MRKYEEYKHSGINWLGNIPSTWNVSRLKNVGKAIIGLTYSPDDLVSENEGMLVLRSSNIQNNKLSLLDNVYVNKKPSSQLITKIGDILICSRNGSRALIGKNIRIDHNSSGVTFGAFMTIFRTKNSDFISYFFNSQLFDYQSGAFMTSTINQLTINTLNRLNIVLPPFSEQQAIANYLDAKTQAIDKKVSLLEQKIATYKKLKRTLINQTITKGLDKNVPLKDSGISWMGQIPQHWEMKRLKDVCKSMSSGATPTSGNLSYYEDGTINWLNTGDLNDGIINSTQKKLNNTVFDDYPNLKIQKKGTLVIAMYGATIGKMGLLDIDSTTNQACCCLNLKNDNFNKFHFYQLLNIKQYIISLSVGGTQPNVSQGILSFIEIVVPPKSEQEEIAKYLDHKTATIDAIVGNISKQIETLKQLRKTLINDVVTGKIKVVE